MSTQISRIQFRRGTSQALATVNEVLLAGEICIETDTGKYKIGDGSTAWSGLDYVNDSLEHETWTMTLDDDTVITKEVATWTSQG